MKSLKKLLVTLGISISGDNDFVSRRSSGSWLRQGRKKIVSKIVGRDISVGNAFSLNGTSDFALGSKCTLRWLHCMDTVHIISEFRWVESLKNKTTNRIFEGLFGFVVSIAHNSISITHNSKMVGPNDKKFVWFLFPIFVFITQFSDFWVMSYENWKYILGVFSFQNSVFNDIFVIKHTRRDPLSEQHTWGAAFDGLRRCFFLRFSFFFLSFLWSSQPSILFSFFWWSQALFFFLIT